MTGAEDTSACAALDFGRIRIPESVVYRSFVKETVVLNLETGLYHGLNPTAGSMLDALDRLGSIKDAAPLLAKEYGRPLEEVQRDLCTLVKALIERGLLLMEPR